MRWSLESGVRGGCGGHEVVAVVVAAALRARLWLRRARGSSDCGFGCTGCTGGGRCETVVAVGEKGESVVDEVV